MEDNYMKIQVPSKDTNVLPVRMALTSFLSEHNMQIDEIMDIKTAVSEAVTNSIEHAYEQIGKVDIDIRIKDKERVEIEVRDYGKGIEDISLARTLTYTSKPETEHAGVGLNIMESLMDELLIESKEKEGTKILMVKNIKKIKG